MHGWSGEWLTVVRDAAQMCRTTVWSVFGKLLRTRLLGRPWSPSQQDVLHPWLQDVTDLPPGKLWHILLLSASADFRRPVAQDDDPEPVEPLRSQPLMELCLGIPTYVMARSAGDRILVRAAFESDLYYTRLRSPTPMSRP